MELRNFQRQDKARERDKRFVDGGGMVDVQSLPDESSLEAEEVVDDPLLDFLQDIHLFESPDRGT